jgi:hypothetical protein
MRIIKIAVSLFAVAIVAVTPAARASMPSPPADPCGEQALYCPAATNNDLVKILADYPEPSIASPRSLFANPTFAVRRAVSQTIKYQVAINGNVGVDLATLKKQVKETLADDRGWSRLGVRFEYVESGGAFTFVLAEPAKVPGYGYPCDAVWNCNVGNFVVANDDRWMRATDPWNAAGGNIRDYRHMTVNHELGHWLGHDHVGCGGVGQAAPVMQQQSMDLQGCKFNPWPLDSELSSSRLGI